MHQFELIGSQVHKKEPHLGQFYSKFLEYLTTKLSFQMLLMYYQEHVLYYCSKIVTNNQLYFQPELGLYVQEFVSRRVLNGTIPYSEFIPGTDEKPPSSQ